MRPKFFNNVFKTIYDAFASIANILMKTGEPDEVFVVEDDTEEKDEIEVDLPEVDGVWISCIDEASARKILSSLSARRFKGHKREGSQIFLPNEELDTMGYDVLGELVVSYKEKGWLKQHGDKRKI